MVKHRIKIWPIFFESVLDGSKIFEYRINDRDYRKGDLVLMEEFCPEKEVYTGRWVEAEIGFVFHIARTRFCIWSILNKREGKDGSERS